MRVFNGHLFQYTARRVHGRLPQLLRIHFAQALVALDRNFLILLGFFLAFLFFCQFFFGSYFHFFYGAFFADYFVFLGIRIRVVNLLSFFYLVERRLCYVNETAFNHRSEMPVEKRQKKRADMRAVHVCIGRNDYLVVAEF